jgi:hypothetical protein
MSDPNAFDWQYIRRSNGYPSYTYVSPFEWQLRDPRLTRPSIGHGDFAQLQAVLDCPTKPLENILRNGPPAAVRWTNPGMNPGNSRAGKVYELDLDYAREYLYRYGYYA